MWDCPSRRKQSAVSESGSGVNRVVSQSKQGQRLLGGAPMAAQSKSFFVLFSRKANRNVHNEIWDPSWMYSSLPSSFNVSQRREVMKWSNYVSICAIYIKQGVKFQSCAPAASLILCAFTPVLPLDQKHGQNITCNKCIYHHNPFIGGIVLHEICVDSQTQTHFIDV